MVNDRNISGPYDLSVNVGTQPGARKSPRLKRLTSVRKS